MKGSSILKVTATSAAALLISASAMAASSHSPEEVRTYCKTDPIKRLVVSPGLTVQWSLPTTLLTPDDDGVQAGGGGTEVVWQVIGTLGQFDEGEGYCGSLSVGGNFTFSGNDHASMIEDCVTVARFNTGSTKFKSASLHWEGSNLGVRNTLAVTLCDYSNAATAVDNENGLDPNGILPPRPIRNLDCITDNDDFGGGSFTAIHDVQQRKADNNVGLIGGVSDIDFLDTDPIRDIALDASAVKAYASANDGYVTLVIRCADTDGHTNGFLGGQSNAMIIHDPTGDGFPGEPGSIRLDLD